MKSAIGSGAGNDRRPRRRVIDARRLERATGRPEPPLYEDTDTASSAGANGYFGGRSEWYRDNFSGTHFYDISSAFPEAMRRGEP
jgi:hypothetical protein